MNRSRSWQEFQIARREISELYSIARRLPDTPNSDQRLSSQEAVLRAALVMLVGHLHAYLEGLVDERADALQPEWADLNDIERTYVAKQVRRRAQRLLGEYAEESIGDEHTKVRFLEALSDAADWFRKPDTLSTSGDREDLIRFFADLGSAAIVRALRAFRGDGTSFFEWLANKDARYASYWDALGRLLLVRNDSAHGHPGRRPVTLRDAREFRVMVTRLVSHAEDFIAGS